ncbi:thioredoxin 1 [Catalinimonas alkaloidigena]|uniref:Thioredoxin n=1 Tax=Catalinimonas alkaloidigena TaxID=1075417 RepID=A0A1G9G7J4_9BACT|nr:thioredoxin domain-containing protein [Catalinimonas alkaloidigena]SDK96694.1 thioredoxin 1 [Catalinimonas alkaloidigena]
MKTESHGLVELTDQNFQDIKNQNGVLLVELGAEWCGPCKMMAPIMQELARDYQGLATIAELDVDMNPETTVAFGVRGVPTLLVFKDGELVQRFSGATNKRILSQTLNGLVNVTDTAF